MIDFYNTVLGRRFFERDFPALIEAINALAEELRRYNDSHESEGASNDKED